MNPADVCMNQLKENLVLACHIIVDQKLDSGPFGNISLRVPGTETFWVNPEGITFDQVAVRSLVKMDFQGNILEGKYRPHPGEFIHREIYRVRQDVTAIVHTHSENTMFFSLLGCKIEPFTQLGASLYGDQGVYTGFTGPVRTSDEGAEIAAALGKQSIVIAKNHGLFAVSQTIHGALWDMVVADWACKTHLVARQMGIFKADPLSPEFLEKSRVEVRYKQSQFMWASYVRKIRRSVGITDAYEFV